MTQSTAPVQAISYAHIPGSGRKKPRVLVWVVGTIVLLGMGVAVLLPSLCGSTRDHNYNQLHCASNLRTIGQAIQMYANTHRGQYPPSLAVLVGEEDLDGYTMVCPSTLDTPSTATNNSALAADLEAAETHAPGHKQCLSYVYCGQGLDDKSASATTVVAYEPLSNHGGRGANVLFGDGHVDFIDWKHWQPLAAKLPRPAK